MLDFLRLLTRMPLIVRNEPFMPNSPFNLTAEYSDFFDERVPWNDRSIVAVSTRLALNTLLVAAQHKTAEMWSTMCQTGEGNAIFLAEFARGGAVTNEAPARRPNL